MTGAFSFTSMAISATFSKPYVISFGQLFFPSVFTSVSSQEPTKVLYMSFDKFLLAVESRDLSQADKSNIRVSSFPS